MIIWLTGLSGAGKTTIGREVWRIARQHAPNTVFVDGDEIRALFKHNVNTDSHSLKGRRENAERIVEICRWLDRQEIHVVCCILAVFHDVLMENKNLFSSYFEVFVDVPMETLFERDIKNLYAPARRGEIENVVGIDIPYDPPPSPDLVIQNSDRREDFETTAQRILDAAGFTT